MSAEAATNYTTALIWSLLYSGRAKDAADLADREGMLALHRVAATAPPCTNSASYSVLAETYLFNGRLRDSVACARFACDYAIEAADDGCLFRALGVLTAALAMNGDIRPGERGRRCGEATRGAPGSGRPSRRLGPCSSATS